MDTLQACECGHSDGEHVPEGMLMGMPIYGECVHCDCTKFRAKVEP